MGHKNYFSGRVIFDHLQKTAGQAVNAWLMETLGTGSVTMNLAGSHRSLIRQYGGEFPVISGHMVFKGEGLDPRYQYLTLLREPVDRILSWITFLLHDVPRSSGTAALIDGASRFLESDGRDATPDFLDSIGNPYIEHFSTINLVDYPRGDEQKLSAAISAIDAYDVIGLYEDIPSFLSECAGILDIADCDALPSVNRSSRPLSRDRVSPELVYRIIELNALDIRFYNEVAGLVRKRKAQHGAQLAPAAMQRERYDTPPECYVENPKLKLHAAHVRGGEETVCGAMVKIELDFSISEPIEELEVGVMIIDAAGHWVFGTNTSLLGSVQKNVKPGRYHGTYLLSGHLPEGAYTATFGFNELRSGKRTELAWHGGLCKFTIRRPGTDISVGPLHLPACILISEVSEGGHRYVERLIRVYRRTLAMALIWCKSVMVAATPGAKWL